ncbi:MAG: hypothetical protein SGI83_17265 [Bacteroidota bacterium]|nr:hypothetical protein [Bacteroidota bacterium]
MKTIIPATGLSNTFTKIWDLGPGMYFLLLMDGIGNVETVKLLKN